jgi:hypothetical protein
MSDNRPTERRTKVLKDYPTLRCKKSDAKKEGYTHGLVLRDYIYLTKSAGYIDLLEKKKRAIAQQVHGTNLTDIVNSAYAEAIENLYDRMLQVDTYRKQYNEKDYDDIPNEIKNVLDSEAIAFSNRDRARWQTELRTQWLPEFKELGYDGFIKRWGHHRRIDDILTYCQKNAQISDMVMSKASDDTTTQLRALLVSISKEQDAISLSDIVTAAVNEGIMPDRESNPEEWSSAKNLLKVLGSNLGLSKNNLGRGIWNLTPIQSEVVNK